MSAGTSAKKIKPPPVPVLRKMENLSSLSELSVHVKVIDVEVTRVGCASDGVSGGMGVVALASFE